MSVADTLSGTLTGPLALEGAMSTAEPTAFDPTAIEERAFKASLTAEPQEMSSFLLDTIGARITAAAIGLSDARPLYQWRAGETTPRAHDTDQRLRVLFRIVHEIAEAYTGRVAASFLRGSNPQLDDEAPLVLLAEGALDKVVPRVIAAARAFLEG